jgi:bacteriocin biosynthesis cyclodehydratase domain-containing protein
VTATYESLRDCRPRVKQDVLYAKTPNGVLFHNATTGFQVTSRNGYEFASRVMPHLDGRHRFSDLYDVLPEQHRGMLLTLVGTLLERGFVRDVAPDTTVPDGLDDTAMSYFGTQISYIDHYEDGAARRFAALRATRVAVIGVDDVARWAALSLVRNGVAHIAVEPGLDLGGPRSSSISGELKTQAAAGVQTTVTALEATAAGPLWSRFAGYDVLLVCGGAGAGQLVLDLLGEGIPEGVELLAVTRLGQRCVVGPLMTADRVGCLICALLRLGANGDAGTAADLWADLAVGVAAPEQRSMSRSLAGMLGNLLGYEVFRSATGAMRPETRDAVIVQDLESMDVVTQVLLPHPACPRCPTAPTADLSGVQPLSEVRLAAADVDRSDPDFARARAHEPLFGSVAGVFAGYDDAEFTQLPLKVGRVRFGTGHGRQRSVTAFDVHNTLRARVRAGHAAARSYAETEGTRRVASPVPEGLRRIGPDRLTLRAVTTAVPETQEWLLGTSLLDRQQAAVPAAAVWPSGRANAAGVFHRTGAGLGAGETPGHAVGDGLLRALGVELLLAAATGAAVTHLVEVGDTEACAELGYLRTSAATTGLEVELLDLAGDGPQSAVLARAADPGTGLPRWALGVGLAWVDAATDALRDLVGAAQTGAELPDGAVDTGPSLLSGFDPFVVTATSTVPAPLERTAGWDEVLDALRISGRDVIVVDVRSTDLTRGGISVLRVLVTEADAR